jgi:hypothetical protein
VGGMIKLKDFNEQIVWPKYCGCCGDNSDSFYEIPVHRYTARQGPVNRYYTIFSKIPICSYCLSHGNRFKEALLKNNAINPTSNWGFVAVTWLMIIIPGILVIGGIIGAAEAYPENRTEALENLTALLVGIPLLLLGFRLLKKLLSKKNVAYNNYVSAEKQKLKAKCYQPGLPVETNESEYNNDIELVFYNNTYMNDFIELNKANIAKTDIY